MKPDLAGRCVSHSKAINDALDSLFKVMRQAENDGFNTHIYVPEGSAKEAAGEAYVELSLTHTVKSRAAK